MGHIKAATQFSNVDEAFLDISRQIERVARSLSSGLKAPAAAVPLARPAPVIATTQMPRSANLNIAQKYTDFDQDVFIDEAFEAVARYFQGSLEELKQRHGQLETKFTRMDATWFSAVAYVNGQSRVQCMVFKGGLGGHAKAISFSHQISENTNDKSILPIPRRQNLWMGRTITPTATQTNLKKVSTRLRRPQAPIFRFVFLR